MDYIKNKMSYLNNITTTQLPWFLLAAFSLAFELTALFFQYGLGLAPCIMCVYQRLAILSIVTAGVIGGVGCNNIFGRTIGFALWGTSAIWGLLIAIEHVEIQENSNSLFYSCDIIPNFPTWAPLHEWIPFLFEATGDCGKISWEFLSYSMPQWMVVVFGLYSIAFVVVLLNRLIAAKKP